MNDTKEAVSSTEVKAKYFTPNVWFLINRLVLIYFIAWIALDKTESLIYLKVILLCVIINGFCEWVITTNQTAMIDYFLRHEAAVPEIRKKYRGIDLFLNLAIVGGLCYLGFFFWAFFFGVATILWGNKFIDKFWQIKLCKQEIDNSADKE